MKRCRSGVMVGIPVENEHNRVVRPPRQACHRKGSGANRYNRNDRYNRQQAWDKATERFCSTRSYSTSTAIGRFTCKKDGQKRPRPASARGVNECLSCMNGNIHVRFLGEGVAATSPPYPTSRWMAVASGGGSVAGLSPLAPTSWGVGRDGVERGEPPFPGARKWVGPPALSEHT